MKPRRLAVTLSAAALALATLAGCGHDASEPIAPRGPAAGFKLTIGAATSLQAPLRAWGERVSPVPRSTFAGSDTIASQLREGFDYDVVALASPELAEQLRREGRLTEPVVFATNELVLAVPAGARSPQISSLDDLRASGVTIAVGRAGVPIGDYTEQLLERLPAATAAAIRRNVRTREPDVGGVVGKLSQGAVDAGFVYTSDVKSSGGRLRAIRLPADARPRVEYAASAVAGSDHGDAAQEYVEGLLTRAAAERLRAAGLQPVTAP